MQNPLRQPVGIHVDRSGRVAVTEQSADRIVRRGCGGLELGCAHNQSRHPETPKNKFAGSWVFVDGRGRIYRTADGEHAVVRFDDFNGTNRVAFGTEGSGVGQFHHPAGVCVDKSGRIYVADFDNFRIVRIDNMNGTNWTSYGAYGTGTGTFINPCGICLDANERIYIADQGNDRVVRIDDMTGTNWTSIGVFGTARVPAMLYAPCGVCVDGSGGIYVTEASSNHRIVRMDDMTGAGWITTAIPGSGRGEFASPMGIFVR